MAGRGLDEFGDVNLGDAPELGIAASSTGKVVLKGLVRRVLNGLCAPLRPPW